ncbi:hypothetical protein MNV49_007848 [Pseudohyphozyma bogoriensis]|nr:hypothetical protein MNV49_007848 [Pseudohyphozyma bogoriensis]
MGQPTLTLYLWKGSGFSNRVSWALEEVGATYDVCLINSTDKPAFFLTGVNPAGLVPVLQVGPSLQDSVKIPESVVILEYLAEIFPEANLLTGDPLKNAHGRYFADPASAPKLFDSLVELQSLFDRYPGKYLLGDEITLGDFLVGPFLARAFAFAEGGLIQTGDAGRTLLQDPRWEGLRKYNEAIAQRPAFQRTFDKAYIIPYWIEKLGLTDIVPLVR